MTKISKRSAISGTLNEIEIPMSDEEFTKAYEVYKAGALIQVAFPNLTPAQREFIMTGITQEEWDEMFFQTEE